MARPIIIDASWDGEAAVWLATSRDVPGLVVESPSWDGMIEEVRLVLPDLLELDGAPGAVSLTFRAEERRELTGS